MKYHLPNLDPALDSSALKLALTTGGVGTVVRLLRSALELLSDATIEDARRRDIDAGLTKPHDSASLYHMSIFTFLIVSADLVGFEAYGVGRTGMVVKAAETTWIIELEVYRDRGCDGQAKADEALGRILAGRGARRHQGHRVLVGIAIDDDSRAITAWKAQSVMP